jgi:hypothetical protein
LDIEIIDSGVGMSELVSKMMIGVFKLSTSGFTGTEGIGQVSTFSSASSKLGSEVTDSSIKMGDLVSKMMIGIV